MADKIEITAGEVRAGDILHFDTPGDRGHRVKSATPAGKSAVKLDLEGTAAYRPLLKTKLVVTRSRASERAMAEGEKHLKNAEPIEVANGQQLALLEALEALERGAGPNGYTADQLAKKIATTRNAVYRHVAGLIDRGLVEKRARSYHRTGLDRGRPVVVKPLRAQIEQAAAERKARNGKRAAGPRPGSMTDAMVKVLARSDRPLGAAELATEIRRRRLAPNLKGKTPAATISAKLATEAKKQDGLFKRTAPGKFELRRRDKAAA